MSSNRRATACVWMAIGASAFPVSTAFAQDAAGALPAKTVTFVVPNAPGGGPDFLARLIAPKLSDVLRQSVLVENRAAANGIAGTQYVARAAADGSVISFGNAGTHAINAVLYKKLPYDPVRDFAAVSELASAPLVMVAHPAVPAKSIRELIALAKRSPGKLNIAIAGATGELAGNALKLQAKIEMQNIPYKGGGLAVVAVMSGESDLTLTNYVNVAANVEAGKLKLLGVTSAQRSPLLPNLATFAENGLDGYDYELWYGLFVPAKTPPATVQALYREIARIVNAPEVRERLVATGHRVVVSTPEQLTDKVRRDIDKFRRVMVESGMKQED